MVDTETGEEARRLYVAGAKSMLGGLIFVIGVQSPKPWKKIGVRRLSRGFFVPQRVIRRAVAARTVVVMVHAGDGPSRSSRHLRVFRDCHSHQIPSNGMIHAVLICKFRLQTKPTIRR